MALGFEGTSFETQINLSPLDKSATGDSPIIRASHAGKSFSDAASYQVASNVWTPEQRAAAILDANGEIKPVNTRTVYGMVDISKGGPGAMTRKR